MADVTRADEENKDMVSPGTTHEQLCGVGPSDVTDQQRSRPEAPPVATLSTGELERLTRMAAGLERSAQLEAELAEELAGNAQFAMIHRTSAIDLKAEADALRKLLAGAVSPT